MPFQAPPRDRLHGCHAAYVTGPRPAESSVTRLHSVGILSRSLSTTAPAGLEGRCAARRLAVETPVGARPCGRIEAPRLSACSARMHSIAEIARAMNVAAREVFRRRTRQIVHISRRVPHDVAPDSPSSPPFRRCIGRDWRPGCTGMIATPNTISNTDGRLIRSTPR